MKKINLRIIFFAYFTITLLFFFAIILLRYDYASRLYQHINILIDQLSPPGLIVLYGIIFISFVFALLFLIVGLTLWKVKSFHFREANITLKLLMILFSIFTPLIIGILGFAFFYFISYFPISKSDMDYVDYCVTNGCGINLSSNNDAEILPYLMP